MAASILTGNYGHDSLGRKLSEEEEVEVSFSDLLLSYLRLSASF